MIRFLIASLNPISLTSLAPKTIVLSALPNVLALKDTDPSIPKLFIPFVDASSSDC